MEIREGIEMREISRVGGSGDDTDQPRFRDSEDGNVAARVQVWGILVVFCSGGDREG